MKQALVALTILIVLGLGFGIWASNAPQQPMAQMQQILKGEQIGEGNLYRHGEEAPGYTVEVEYPMVELEGAAQTKAQMTLETGVKAQIDDFKANAAGMLDAQELARLQEQGRSYSFAMDYKAYTGDSTVSYAFTIYEDTGGAHPNTYYKTFTFDQSGNEIKITDVIASNPNGLQELSLLVSNDVVAQYKTRAGVDDVTGLIYDEGLSPKAENFENFAIDGDNMVILIPPYQIAAYAVGSFEVRIKLKDIQ